MDRKGKVYIYARVSLARRLVASGLVFCGAFGGPILFHAIVPGGLSAALGMVVGGILGTVAGIFVQLRHAEIRWE